MESMEGEEKMTRSFGSGSQEVDSIGLLPVRCMTCNKVLGHLTNRISHYLSEGKSWEEIMTLLELDRYCCRRVITSNVNVIDEYALYTHLPPTVQLGEFKKGARVYIAR